MPLTRWSGKGSTSQPPSLHARPSSSNWSRDSYLPRGSKPAHRTLTALLTRPTSHADLTWEPVQPLGRCAGAARLRRGLVLLVDVMTNDRPVPTVHVPEQPDAGPSSQPISRSNSPHGSRQHRRPASHGRLVELMVPGRSRSNSGASQSETPVIAYADDGAVSSGRSTPEQRRKSGKGGL